MKLLRIVFHPLVFAAYPVLFLYSQNPGQVRLASLLAPLGFSLFFTITAWGMLRLLLKDWSRSGGIVSVVVLLFFSWGHVQSNIDSTMVIYLMGAFWLAVGAVGVWKIFKSTTAFGDGTKVFNTFAAVLLLLVMIDIVRYGTQNDQSSPSQAFDSADYGASSAAPAQALPDIYFIVLDSYAREDVLNEIYGFDNSPFLGFLRTNGFHVADRAVANYMQTGLSLGSMLNINYLDDWVAQMGDRNRSRAPLAPLIQNSLVIDTVRSLGYQVVAFASTRPETDIKNADVFLGSGVSLNEFAQSVRNATPLPDMTDNSGEDDIFSRYRSMIQFMFDGLSTVATEQASPKFVFAHIEAPHPPFLFDANGESVQLEDRFNDHDGNWLINSGRLSLEQYKTHYIEQLKYVNSQISRAINDIIEHSEREPIVVLFGDHGPRSGLNWDGAENTDVWESMAILNAIRLPGKVDAPVYDELSLVNTFRLIFSEYFGFDYPLLPDRSFYSPAIFLYQFEDVTERVRARQ